MQSSPLTTALVAGLAVLVGGYVLVRILNAPSLALPVLVGVVLLLVIIGTNVNSTPD